MNHPPPEGYRHATPITVRWADMDAFGHVNNAKYLTYAESARLDYLFTVCQPEDFLKIGVILARVSADFYHTLHMGEEVVAYTRCSRLGRKSFDTRTEIVRYQDGVAETAASILGVLVAYDYTAQASIPIPDLWRERILDYEPTRPDGG